MTSKFALLSLILTCQFSLNAWAWREGNGGDAVKSEQGLYLLDLVEAGSEHDVETLEPVANAFFKAELNRLQNQVFETLPKAYLASKLSQIHKKNKVLAIAMMSSLKELSWKWVQFVLPDIQDEGSTLSIPRDQLLQAAFRVNQTVQIHKGTWDQLDERNQAALLLHEVLFALMEPERTSTGMDMNSPRVRTLVGFIFSKEFNQKSLDLVLQTEAPHLALPTPLNPNIDPIWDAHEENVVINRQWYARMMDGDNESFEQISHSSALLGDWVKLVCQRAMDLHTSFRFGLQAERINVAFHSYGEHETQEFYLIPSFLWQSPLAVVEIESPASIVSCRQDINRMMKWITEQTLLDPRLH
jgi:hypothetical protein